MAGAIVAQEPFAPNERGRRMSARPRLTPETAARKALRDALHAPSYEDDMAAVIDNVEEEEP